MKIEEKSVTVRDMTERALKAELWKLDTGREYMLLDVYAEQVLDSFKIRFKLKHIDGCPASECFRQWSDSFLVTSDKPLHRLLAEWIADELEVLRRDYESRGG